MIAGSKSKNPKAVVALDMSQDKLDLAKDCGADVIINIAQEDAVEKVIDMTGGYGG
jgi:erythritol/L-threitol dehydrogenase